MIQIFKFVPLYFLTQSSGESSCHCIFSNSQDLSFTQESSSQTQDNNLQGIGCFDHDINLAPFCALTPAPTFCSLNWCQVDSTICELDDLTPSSLFPGSNLHYSYKTCGDDYNFAKFYTNASKTAAELMTLVEDQVEGFRSAFNTALEEKAVDCPVNDSCNFFQSNPFNSTWQNYATSSHMKVDFNNAFVFSPSHVDKSEQNQRRQTCESKALELEFLATSRAEQTSRVAYMQSGEINEGNYLQWPITESCLDSQDPRQRDWFANASTGPKDVIIMIDKSGSMDGGKMESAREAAKAIIDTLTEFDQATLILFESEAIKYSNTLVPMTRVNKNLMKTQIDDNTQAWGGTNFEAAFNMAFELISDSNVQNQTTNCLRAILFLTDGQSELDIDRLMERNSEYQFKIFAQAIGDEVDTTITKELSCRTDAISFQLPDGGNLSNTMAGYFHYFAAGINDHSIRWIYYNDIITDVELLSACIALYDGKLFKGVSCMDMNVILELSVLQAKSDQDSVFVPALTTTNRTCSNFSFGTSGKQIELLRRSSGGDTCKILSGESESFQKLFVKVITQLLLAFLWAIFIILYCRIFLR